MLALFTKYRKLTVGTILSFPHNSFVSIGNRSIYPWTSCKVLSTRNVYPNVLGVLYPRQYILHVKHLLWAQCEERKSTSTNNVLISCGSSDKKIPVASRNVSFTLHCACICLQNHRHILASTFAYMRLSISSFNRRLWTQVRGTTLKEAWSNAVQWARGLKTHILKKILMIKSWSFWNALTSQRTDKNWWRTKLGVSGDFHLIRWIRRIGQKHPCINWDPFTVLHKYRKTF